jgi:hypothetical protein
MTAQLHHQRLARKSIIGELWEAMAAEEERARKSKKSPDWRKILKTQAMREDAAQTEGTPK